MKTQMLYDRILVAPIEVAEQMSAGGLVLPSLENQNTTVRFAEVKEVGHGRMNANGDLVPMTVKPGDTIMFCRTTNGEQFNWPAMDGTAGWWAVIREPHVVAILTDVPRRSAIVDRAGSGIVLS